MDGNMEVARQALAVALQAVGERRRRKGEGQTCRVAF